MTTKTKQINFDKLIPTLKRFALSDNKKNRKAIEGTAYKEPLFYAYHDGQYLIATDSHRLLRINKGYIEGLPQLEPFLYDLKNKEIMTSNYNYPDALRLIPGDKQKSFILEDEFSKSFKKSLDELIKESPKNDPVIKFEKLSDSIKCSYHIDKAINFQMPISNYSDEFELHINAKYLRDAFTTISKLSSLTNKPVHFNFISKFRPIHITDYESFNIVLLPVRVH